MLALCMTATRERSHHWTHFAPGTTGVCVEFDGPGLSQWAGDISRMQCRSVTYRTIKAMETTCPQRPTLPFLKRYAYVDEQEFRLLYGDDAVGPDEKWFELDLQLIQRITINPWLEENDANEVRKRINARLKRLKSDIRVQRSLLLENKRWKQLATRAGNASERRSGT